MKYVIRFDDDEALDPALVGQKFCFLAKASRNGFAVPLAVAIRTEANKFYIHNKKWPEGLFEEVRQAAEELGLAKGLSVRSSATSEDLEDQSFAGQYETFLNVKDGENLRDKIEKCWESAATEVVRSYMGFRNGSDVGEEMPLMGVIVQKMVHAMAAGVAFSRNPMYPVRNEVVIEGVRGLGEKLVSGHATPQRAFVRGDGSVDMEMDNLSEGSERKEEELVLEKDQWQKIAALAGRAEERAGGKPQDIEWAIDREWNLWLLQSRAITTIREKDLHVPAGVWTRKIADDLWADRLTPFLADVMVRNAPRFDLSGMASFVGIPAVRPTLAVINGFLYVNCESLKQVLTVVPSKLRIAQVKSLFPPGFEMDQIPPPPLFRLIRLAVKSVLFLLKEPKMHPLFCCRASRREQKGLENMIDVIAQLPDSSSREALHKTRAALECMTFIQQNNQWPYTHATLFTWALRWLIVDVAGLPHSEFLRLLSGKGKNVTIEIEREFKKLASKIREDKELLARFKEESPHELANSLPEPFSKDLKDFLSRYGCRSRHRTLYVNRWAEAPHEVLGMLKALLRSPSTQDLGFSAPKNTGTMLKSVSHTLNPITWLGVAISLKFAGIFLDLREDLRFLLDKALYQIRSSLLALGKNTGLHDKVLFLTQEELEQVVREKMSSDEAKSIASYRYEAFIKPAEAYTFYVDGRPMEELSLKEGFLRGIGTSPGRVTGRARIVEDPTQIHIERGDILVAKNTDPGWTPVLSMVSGIIVEEGGLLNHCSIVARELGIPAIVSVREATKKIPEGTAVTIDAGLGVITR